MKSLALALITIAMQLCCTRGNKQSYLVAPVKQQGDGKNAVRSVIPTYSFEYRSSQPLDVKFTSGTSIYQCTVTEIAPVGTSVKSDLKLGVYSHNMRKNIAFKIVGGNSAMFKVESRRISDFVFMDIKTNNVLNRERKSSYLLSVAAVDSTSKVILDRARVNVTISDVNDNRPMFLERRIYAKVREDISLHSSIAQVKAVDADVGENGLVYFSFQRKTHYFAIDPTTGVVSVTRKLDATTNNNYILAVLAQDRSLPPYAPQSSRNCRINVTVEAVNQFSPTISVETELENVTEGKSGFVYSVIKVNDRDKGKSGEIDKVEITSGNEKSTFAVKLSRKTSDEYSVEVIKPLDREKSNRGYHDFVINVTDKGSPPKSTTRAFHIKILDANDMKPIFNQSSYSATISELAPANTPVIRVFASDKDAGLNREIMYALTKGNEHGKFTINADTGLISTKTQLDYEIKSKFNLQVAALDKGPRETLKMSFVQVSINILDANDHSPVFQQPSYKKDLYEDLLKGTSVLTVSATDDDSGSNGMVKYNIVNEDPVPFEIDPDTGVISTTRTLDRDVGVPEFVTLRVRASDFGTPMRREIETLVHISVKALNDNKPVFKQFHCNVLISELAPKGTVLTRLTAVDIDVDSKSDIRYRFVVGNTGDNFVVDAKTGIVKTAKKLTKDMKANLYVIASDGIQESADPVFLTVKVVSRRQARRLSNHIAVTCVDAPDFARAERIKAQQKSFKPSSPSPNKVPQLPENKHAPIMLIPVAQSIKEDLPVGATVGKVTATDKDSGYNGLIVYSIVSGNEGDVFEIDMFSGETRLSSHLDREKKSQYKLNISASDCGLPIKVSHVFLTISVTDVNDNAPMFEKPLTTVSLFENITTGQTVITVHAIDPDEGSNSEVTYQLVDTFGGKFRINRKTGRIAVNSRLDFEQQQSFLVQVQALDGSKTDQKIGFTKVDVQLLDLNDNAPIVTPNVLIVSVPEDVPEEAIVTSINAFDPDTGRGGKLKYKFASSIKKFKIDSESGIIRVRRRLNYERKTSYNLTVEVMDKGHPSLSSLVHVTINIKDVNENNLAPQFTGQPLLRGAVSENMPAGTTILKAFAKDKDSWYWKYALIDGTGLDKFAIDPDSGVISTTKVLDHEKADHYWLTIQAKDGEHHPLYSNIPVLIEVRDVNDEPPYFDPPVYYPSVPERSLVGTSVVQIVAKDPDSDGSKLRYSIIRGNENGYFMINGQTGLITTVSSLLDREDVDKFPLTVSVSDGGLPPKFASTSFVVTVSDVNDNTPVFWESSYSAELEERSASTSPAPLFHLFANDDDVGTNADLTYSIVNGNRDNTFTINPKNGTISTKKALFDMDEYELTVNVVDGGNPARGSNVSVLFNVGPKNPRSNSAPAFINSVKYVTIKEGKPIGEFLTNVYADPPNSNLLLYYFISGNTGNKFTIDPRGGIITVAGNLDYETQKSFVLKVAASDSYNVAVATIFVNITDVNDNAPQPLRKEYQVHIKESSAPGTLVTKVKAVDPDSEAFGEVKYSIVSSAMLKSISLFNIHTTTGEIRTTKRLDFEDMKKHVLVIKAADSDIKDKMNLFYVVISVDDVNDHKPEFVRLSYEVECDISAVVSSNVVKVFAVDADAGSNAQIKYSITAGNSENAFYIDQNTGAVQVAKVLRPEIKLYKLTVQAIDSGVLPLSNTINVEVSVRGIMEPLKFVKPLYQASVAENAPPNQPIITVYFNGTMVSYKLVPRNGDCWKSFQINRQNGLITNKIVFDAELLSQCKLTVRAVSADGRHDDTQAIIAITDENDNSPQFALAHYNGHVLEASSQGTTVLTTGERPLTVQASDADSGVNSKLMYEIVEQSARNLFQVDALTGTITTTQILDYETTKSYQFQVKVSDGGVPRRSAFTMVTIDVKDVNDVAPVFTRAIYDTVLYLPVVRGTKVTTVTATDRDSPPLTNLTYTAVSPVFEIGLRGGEIKVKDASRLQPTTFKLTIVASDGKNTDSATVNILCTAVPASDLKFSQANYSTSVKEGLTASKELLAMRAIGYTLEDSVTYSIVSPTDLFLIGKGTGVLHLRGSRAIDRETIDRYSLIVQAHDERRPPRIARTSVVVSVIDRNDNMPTFTESPYYVIVQLDVSPGARIGRVKATDADIGSNGEIRYNLKKGGEGRFRVASISGEIILNRAVDDVTVPRTFDLQVEAIDRGRPAFKTTVEVKVKVVDKETPIFDHQNYAVSIPENIRVGSHVKTIRARSPSGSTILYSITRGDPLNQFSVDFRTGEIVVSAPLDYETEPKFILTARATDAKTGAHTENPVVVTISDVNDLAPVFNSSFYLGKVSESAAVGTSVMAVYASDGDEGTNRRIKYRFQKNGKSATDFFTVDEDTGVIRTAKKIDYELHVVHELPIVAADGGTPPLTGEARVRIVVEDANDNPPRFEKSVYAASILGNAVPGHFVTRVIATDPDESDIHKLSYKMISGLGKERFNIDAKSGVITLSRDMGVEHGKFYQINVEVTDDKHIANCKVNIVIGATNEYSPSFSQDVYLVDLYENVPEGTFVTMVAATDRDSGSFAQLRYSIDSAEAEAKFSIDRDTGMIYSRTMFDRENISHVVMSIPVRATDGGGRFSFCTVEVHIKDENDNQPSFEFGTYEVTVPVSIKINTPVLMTSATDADAGRNSKLSYAILGHQTPPVFTINSDTGIIAVAREPEVKTYKFFVFVKDGGNPRLHRLVPAQIHVLSQGAKIVRFEKSKYDIDVSESANIGDAVGQLRLIVPGGNNARVDYTIVHGRLPDAANENFLVDSNGRIKLLKNLDFETMKRYVMVIEANVTSINQLARTAVVVRVQDRNDNKPVFVSNPYLVSVPENIDVGSRVLRVFAEDLDSGHNGEVEYSFDGADQTTLRKFGVDSRTGWITTKGRLDREQAESFVFNIRATDKGTPSRLFGTTSIHVTLLDVNDSPPRFLKPKYLTSVKEDALIGQEVTTVVATDADVNSAVHYFIMSGDPKAMFNIERKTGKIFVQGPLDRESVSSYQLNISASDGLFTSFVVVAIRVLDANDNSPVCKQSLYTTHVSEDVRVNTPVLTVSATDADIGSNAVVRYTVSGQGVGVFAVDKDSGIMRTKVKLDREVRPRYNFLVAAVDGGGQTCYTNVTINLMDVNDNPPRFSQARYVHSVYEDAPINKILLQVRATDPDLGINRKTSYSLVNNAHGTFSIESGTGIISLKKFLNREKRKNYTLRVKVEDAGQPSKNAHALVQINVLNINDVPPEFANSTYKVRVREDLGVGSVVVHVRAVSKEDKSEVISYKILKSPDAGAFTINTNTGVIKLKKSLDYETGPRSYTLTIQASDSGPPVLAATTVVKVAVTDANDNEPVFKKAVYRERVDENSPVDTIVGQVFATDLDSNDNSKIRYSIGGGNSAGKFKINRNSGLISVAGRVDRERKSSYKLTVRAQDMGTPAKSTEAKVHITVNDLNDNPPEFTRSNFTVTLREDAKYGKTVLHLRPHDRDAHGNGSPFTFTLLSGDTNKFFLTPQGAVTKIARVTKLDKPHVLRIQVGDSGEPPLSTIVTVTIKVVEGITHPPEVKPLTIHVNLYGSNFNGGRIGHIKVMDPDDDQVIFALVGDRSGGPFSVSPDGTVSTTGNVGVGMYNLTVRARDPKYTVYTHVTVIVRDIPDRALANSVTLRLADMSAGTFVERHFAHCKRELGRALKVSSNKVHIWSMQSSGDDLDLVVAVQKSSSGYFKGAHVLKKINATLGDFERGVGVRLRTVGVRQCDRRRCPAHLTCSDVYKPENKQIRFMSDEMSYISYEHSRSHACICKDGSGDCTGDLRKCSSKPCAPGYVCSEVAHGYQCKYKDETACEDTSCIKGKNAGSLDGNGYIRYNLKETFDQPSRSVSLAVRTVEEQGTLVFAGGQYDYSILEIAKGYVQLRFDFGSGAGMVIIDWSRVDDGKWHHVAVERHGNHATLILDKKHRASGQSPGKMRILNLDGNPIYFGAKVVNTRSRRDSGGNAVLVTNGIKGCLQNLKLNGRNLPMTSSNSHATAHPKSMRPGCRTSGACALSKCPRFGDCVETFTSYKCVCRPGHSGLNCDANIKCDARPCLNGGTCMDLPKGYSCACAYGYTGSQCHIFVGACSSMPCKHGGTCRFEKNGGYTCKCPQGVSGISCEIDSRPCSSNPCNFDGNCTNVGDDYKCQCPLGLSGKNCEEGFHCNRIPCKNGGSCDVGPSGAKCSCTQGFMGLDCSRDVNECQQRNPCKNGGRCLNTHGSFFCNCTKSYAGDLCESMLPNVSAATGGPLETTEIIVIAVFLVLLILIVLLVVIALRRRTRRKHRKSAKDVKVSPPVVGPNMQPAIPPTPPPRQVLGYELQELSMPPGYDAEDSWGRRQRAQKTFNASDTNIPGYHWDYTDTPIDLVPRKPGVLSKNKSASYMGVPDDSCRYVDMPNSAHPESLKASRSSDLSEVPMVPQRPRNLRLSESEDGPPEIPHMPRKPVEYRKGRWVAPSSRYSVDSRLSDCSDFTDINDYKASSIGGDSAYPDLFRGRFPAPPHDPYPESCDNVPVGSYVPTLKTRSELGSVTDGAYSEDELEQLYLGNRLEVCGESPENSYLHSENASEDGDIEDCYVTGYGEEDRDLQDYNQEIRKVMEGLEVLAHESQL